MIYGLDQLVTEGNRLGASDIHLVSGLSVTYRVHGSIISTDTPPLTVEDIWGWDEVLPEDVRQKLSKEKQADYALGLADGNRLRANVIMHQQGIGIALRIINSVAPPINSIGIAPSLIRDIMSLEHGLVLVVGPTGHGKSTTLASIMQEKINTEKNKILTVEDPIEYSYTSSSSIILQRQIGRDVIDFAQGLRAAMRQDPDIILIGEMRDRQTIKAALTAAETGHIVFSTLHTNSAYETVTRIIDSFPGDQQAQVRAQLSMNLKVIISQRLVPTADGNGRVLAYESLRSSTAVSATIREGRTHLLPQVIELDKSGSMVSLEESLVSLVMSNKITRKVGYFFAGKKDSFQQLLELKTEEF
jgi:twitching motility protein PilT